MYRTLAFHDGPTETQIFSIDSLRGSRIETFRGHKTSRRTILVLSIILIATAGLLATWIFIARPRFYPKLGIYTRSVGSYDDVVDIRKSSSHFLDRRRRAVERDNTSSTMTPEVSMEMPSRKHGFNVEYLTRQEDFPINDSRLPFDLIPEEYFLDLSINVDDDNFTGSVKLVFICDRKTNKIIFHGRRIVLFNASVILERQNVLYRRIVYLNKFELFLIELDGELIEGKSYELYLQYSVGYGQNLAGLYKSNYTSQGEIKSMASTHFEPTDARSAFPCLDEPFFKAKFHISIKHHKDLIALSNMPLKQTNVVDNNMVRDTFDASVRMSTYLVAFTVNDFKYKETNTTSGIKVRVYAREDDYNRTDYAVEAGAKVISFYEEFFQIKYPLPKLDLLAVPDFLAGAMEDWGLVSFRSAYLIFDKEVMTVEYLRQITLVIAHELAHQWFGNLVTMKWWNDIWLNEGFANFVEMLGTNHVNEQFNALDIQVPTGWQAAIASDSLQNSHPVSQNVSKTSEINELFDTISYNKGAALLRMVQGFMGDNFIKGVKTYLEEYKYSNAETDDLWKHLSKSSDGLDIKAIMDTWTKQRCFPVLTLYRGNDSKFIVSQESFLEMKARLQPVENATNVTDASGVEANSSLWQIPFTYMSDESLKPRTVWLKTKDTKLDLDTTVSWLKGNVDSKGFYILNYDNATWKALQRQLVDDHEVFSPLNRAGLIHDAFKLACEEILDPIIALELTKYLSKEWNYIPWAMMRSRTECFYPLVHEKSVKLKLKKYFWKLQAHLTNIEMLDYANETVKRNLTILERLQLMESFSFALKHHLRNDYKERVHDIFEELVEGKKPTFSAEIRALSLMYGYNSTKESHWNYLWDLYVKSEVDTDRKIVMKAFAQFKEKTKVAQILERSMDKNTMRVQDTIPLLANMVKIGSRQQVWEFVVKNYESFKDRYGGGYQLGQLFNEVAGGFNTQDQLNEVKEFFAGRPIGAKGSRTEKQILEKIRNNIRRHADRDTSKKATNNIKQWLEQEENK